MAIGIIGRTFHKNSSYPVVLVQGKATGDAEDKPLKGKEHSVVGIYVATTSDGTPIYVEINGWGPMYPSVRAVRKGNSILAVGTLTVKDNKGQRYYSINADFITMSGAGLCDVRPENESDDGDSEPPFDVVDDTQEVAAEPRLTQKKRGKKTANV